MKDKAGNVIEPGCYIIYGHNLGRCAGLRYGKVLEVVPEPPYDPTIPSWDDNRPKAGVVVIGIDDDWDHRSAELLSKKSKLWFNDRMLVLADWQVPERYKELLEDYKIK